MFTNLVWGVSFKQVAKCKYYKNIHDWTLYKLQCSCTIKKLRVKEKKKKIFVIHKTDRGVVFRLYKELLYINKGNTTK